MKRKYWILSILTLSIIALDQVTKWEILKRFHLGESISVLPGLFNITYIQNTGAAFGILANSDPSFRRPFFLIVPLVALFAISYIFRKIPDKDVKLSTALSLVIGGAVGNLIDRVYLKFVVDFLDFHWKYQYHFPAFNVADSAICVGVGILTLDLIFNDPEGASFAPASSGGKTNAPTAI